MLILTRRVGERIRIGDDIWVTISGVQGGQVKIGFDLPKEVHVVREELINRPVPSRVQVKGAARP